MAFDKERAKQITEETIQYNLRHKDYDQTVEIARKSRIFVTGEGQDTEYLINLRDKESQRQKDLRVKVTNPITSFALNPVKTQFEKIWRVDGVRVDIMHEDNDALAKINDAVETYHSNSNITEYFRRRYINFQFTDPNAWHMTERRNVMDDTGKIEKVDVYPFEVTSEQAINYQYDNGVPVWLIVEQKRLEVSKKKDAKGKTEMVTEEVSDFYFYAAGTSILYREYINDEPEEGAITTQIEQEDNKTRNFVYADFDTGSEEFPGQKFGCYDDPASDGTLKVPPFWTGARFLLEDLIGKKSSFDVSVYSHVYPKLFHYDEKCNYQADNGNFCQDGFINGDINHKCPACKGSGGQIHVSEMDVITFNLPPNMEDLSKLPALSDLAYYHEPPLNVTEALYQWVNDLREQIYMASFNTSNVDRALVSKTATEITGIWDEVNTRVYPCAAWMSRLYEKTVRVAAQYLDAYDKEKFFVNHTVPMDMKLEPLDVLIDRYQRAKNAGLSYDVRWNIHCDILGKTYIDAPSVVEDIKAWENWKPFKSMDAETIALILSTRAADDYDKLLYENWDSVKMEVETKLGDKTEFSELPKDKQLKFIQDAVKKVGSEIKTDEPEPLPMPDLTLDPQPDPQAAPEPAI